MSNNKIDIALKKALGDWEYPVDAAALQSILNSINSKPSNSYKRLGFWLFLTLSTLGLSSYYYYNFRSNNKHTNIEIVKSRSAKTQFQIPNTKIKDAETKHELIINERKSNTAIKTENVSKILFTSVTQPISSHSVLGADVYDDEISNLISHHIFYTKRTDLAPPFYSEINIPNKTNNSSAIRPKKKNHELKTGPEILISAGIGYAGEKLTNTTTSSITHKDYQKVWSSAKNNGWVYNTKIEYFQPINKIKGLGISGGINYIKSIQQIAFNYTYSDIPVRDSASNQILGYVHLSNPQQQIIPNANVINTELALSTRVYFTPLHTRLMDFRVLVGSSINVYSKSNGIFYDVDKASLIQNTRKHKGMLIPEWGIAVRYYISEHTNLNIGYNGRLSKWNLTQFHGSIRTQALQQNVQIGIGVIF